MSQEKPWEGDHGFTGIALLAWERQRAAYRMVDAHIAWRTDKDPKVRGCYALLLAWARSCPCPQTLGPGGTSEGADWVSQKRPCPEKPDLSGANLFRADLYGADLSGANLFRANLFRANLYGADLTGADLFRANLTGADLTGADLTGADLEEWERGEDGYARRKTAKGA